MEIIYMLKKLNNLSVTKSGHFVTLGQYAAFWDFIKVRHVMSGQRHILEQFHIKRYANPV